MADLPNEKITKIDENIRINKQKDSGTMSSTFSAAGSRSVGKRNHELKSETSSSNEKCE